MTGVTAEEFVETPKVANCSANLELSKMEILRGLLAKELRIPLTNVLIFSVMNTPGQSRTVDIRYAAHGPSLYRRSRLDGRVITGKTEVCYSLFSDLDNAFLMPLLLYSELR